MVGAAKIAKVALSRCSRSCIKPVLPTRRFAILNGGILLGEDTACALPGALPFVSR